MFPTASTAISREGLCLVKRGGGDVPEFGRKLGGKLWPSYVF